MTSLARTRPTGAAPSRRPAGVVRATLCNEVSDAQTVVVDSVVRLLAVGGTAEGARLSAQALSGVSTPLGLSPERHSGLDTAITRTARVTTALPDQSGSAQPIAHQGALPVDNDPNVKPGTDACAKRTSIGTTACVSGFGVAFMCVCWAGLGACSGIFSRSSSHGVCAERTTAHDVAPVVTRGTLPIARSNPTSRWGFKRLLRATFYAATQTIGVNRAPSLEMVIGVAAPFNAAFLAEPNPHLRKHANKHGQQTGAANMRASREKFARVAGNAQAIPASNAAPFHSARLTPRAPSPAAAGIFYLTGQHVRIVTTARNCSARSDGGSRVLMAGAR